MPCRKKHRVGGKRLLKWPLSCRYLTQIYVNGRRSLCEFFYNSLILFSELQPGQQRTDIMPACKARKIPRAHFRGSNDSWDRQSTSMPGANPHNGESNHPTRGNKTTITS